MLFNREDIIFLFIVLFLFIFFFDINLYSSKIISIVEPLSEYNIQLEHPENVDINQIQQVVTKCISKECNDLNASNEFSINSVKDDVKKLDALVNEIKNTLSNTTYDKKNLDFPNTENRPPAPVHVMNPTKHMEHYGSIGFYIRKS